MSDFRQLNVWQEAHSFARVIYRLTDRFPVAERYCLTNQLRRAALSIPANIAECCGRRFPSDQRRFLDIAQGSGREALAMLILARDVGFLAAPDYAPLEKTLDDIQRMLYGMVRLRRRWARDNRGPQSPES